MIIYCEFLGRLAEFFSFEANFIEEDAILAKILEEIAEIAVSQNNCSSLASFFEETLQSLLNSARFEKKLGLVDESVAILLRMLRKLEENAGLSQENECVASCGKLLILLVMKWEDYLRNSWESLKVFVILLRNREESASFS